MTAQWLLLVDIDGTVRHGKDQLGRFVNHPDDVVVFPEASLMLNAWRAHRGHVVGVTNQAGVALGYMTHDVARAALVETERQCEWAFDKILMCCHPPDSCFCRKPRPGMAYRYIASRPGWFRPDQTLVVGDRDDDAMMAAALGVEFLDAAVWRQGVYPPRFRHLLPTATP